MCAAGGPPPQHWHASATSLTHLLCQHSFHTSSIALLPSCKSKTSLLIRTVGPTHPAALQDFEGITPNLLARTIETVEGGGIIVMLLSTLTSLKQLFTLTMDAHARLKTESHQDVRGPHP